MEESVFASQVLVGGDVTNVFLHSITSVVMVALVSKNFIHESYNLSMNLQLAIATLLEW